MGIHAKCQLIVAEIEVDLDNTFTYDISVGRRETVTEIHFYEPQLVNFWIDGVLAGCATLKKGNLEFGNLSIRESPGVVKLGNYMQV